MEFDFVSYAMGRAAGGGGSAPVIQSLNATANGTYTAPSGVDGYSPVTVNVSGGGGVEGTQINPWPSGVQLAYSNGVSIESQAVDPSGTATVSFREHPGAFEFFCIALGELDKNGTYLLEFDYQTTAGEFFPGGAWNLGFDVSKTALSSQPSNASRALAYPNNIVRDMVKRHYKMYFRARNASDSATPPTGTQNMYANFNVWGYSDEITNYFTISNLRLIKVI